MRSTAVPGYSSSITLLLILRSVLFLLLEELFEKDDARRPVSVAIFCRASPLDVMTVLTKFDALLFRPEAQYVFLDENGTNVPKTYNETREIRI
eukprot:CAMPEP_0194131838 /NCGR_PEP_ID=MMETSP0152-20130528/2490_1 /TAXON_ID=1049557 /ORGANISM="Thalassiothrix antarctica, Strain L6-D1" /LENGTH=93 /DNA_ID=CAMNT_0038826721 /DNA_START=615 /DNA_END=896 /DNA_ORIENTATION=-